MGGLTVVCSGYKTHTTVTQTQTTLATIYYLDESAVTQHAHKIHSPSPTCGSNLQ